MSVAEQLAPQEADITSRRGAVRVAFVGKGGAGKSAIAGTFARALARRGEPVLAIDVDHVPGLALSLGLEVDDAPPIPDEALEENPEQGTGLPFRLVPGLSAVEAVERFSALAPDGVRFLQYGNVVNADLTTFRRTLCAFRQILDDMPQRHWSLVGDLPAGTMLAFAGLANFADVVVVVVEPMAKSLLSARRLAKLSASEHSPKSIVALASKVRSDDDIDLVRSRCGLEVIASVPFDQALVAAERDRRAPIDQVRPSPAVRAVEALVDRLVPTP